MTHPPLQGSEGQAARSGAGPTQHAGLAAAQPAGGAAAVTVAPPPHALPSALKHRKCKGNELQGGGTCESAPVSSVMSHSMPSASTPRSKTQGDKISNSHPSAARCRTPCPAPAPAPHTWCPSPAASPSPACGGPRCGGGQGGRGSRWAPVEECKHRLGQQNGCGVQAGRRVAIAAPLLPRAASPGPPPPHNAGAPVRVGQQAAPRDGKAGAGRRVLALALPGERKVGLGVHREHLAVATAGRDGKGGVQGRVQGTDNSTSAPTATQTRPPTDGQPPGGRPCLCPPRPPSPPPPSGCPLCGTCLPVPPPRPPWGSAATARRARRRWRRPRRRRRRRPHNFRCRRRRRRRVWGGAQHQQHDQFGGPRGE